ncbi:hypothetical protein GUITHDRAFT_147232 [Guillardia theta CCMP2712]|uniref:Uncharacterized protein n=1 Tax=Guillardia theta (strain CCMP2712) TaxID=905079 RepID=L1IEW5_GUITC|nr:hypothetical protein GUITHDRAFT_147232 [Guillardia theta CCMP2712]EKX34459.1 hypothetical protein GUITHDRAFT_147232 [Guillardia theta CCMP2712]|eukprot:XP_005821439.1 hypothetical protein GUITHDRAFT_147232 [Guillardia theta CCMP2712]
MAMRALLSCSFMFVLMLVIDHGLLSAQSSVSAMAPSFSKGQLCRPTNLMLRGGRGTRKARPVEESSESVQQLLPVSTEEADVGRWEKDGGMEREDEEERMAEEEEEEEEQEEQEEGRQQDGSLQSAHQAPMVDRIFRQCQDSMRKTQEEEEEAVVLLLLPCPLLTSRQVRQARAKWLRDGGNHVFAVELVDSLRRLAISEQTRAGGAGAGAGAGSKEGRKQDSKRILINNEVASVLSQQGTFRSSEKRMLEAAGVHPAILLAAGRYFMELFLRVLKRSASTPCNVTTAACTSSSSSSASSSSSFHTEPSERQFHALAHLHLGDLEMRRGHEDSAYIHLQAALLANSSIAEAAYLKAKLLFQLVQGNHLALATLEEQEEAKQQQQQPEQEQESSVVGVSIAGDKQTRLLLGSHPAICSSVMKEMRRKRLSVRALLSHVVSLLEGNAEKLGQAGEQAEAFLLLARTHIAISMLQQEKSRRKEEEGLQEARKAAEDGLKKQLHHPDLLLLLGEASAMLTLRSSLFPVLRTLGESLPRARQLLRYARAEQDAQHADIVEEVCRPLLLAPPPPSPSSKRSFAQLACLYAQTLANPVRDSKGAKGKQRGGEDRPRGRDGKGKGEEGGGEALRKKREKARELFERSVKEVKLEPECGESDDDQAEERGSNKTKSDIYTSYAHWNHYYLDKPSEAAELLDKAILYNPSNTPAGLHRRLLQEEEEELKLEELEREYPGLRDKSLLQDFIKIVEKSRASSAANIAASDNGDLPPTSAGAGAEGGTGQKRKRIFDWQGPGM